MPSAQNGYFRGICKNSYSTVISAEAHTVIRKGNKLMFMTNSLNRHEGITDNISKSRKNNQKT
jgi:hypothetical protein